MVTFCIIHIGNRKIFLKHHSPESQLSLLHVSVFSYLGGGGEMISHSPKCDALASPNISIWIFGIFGGGGGNDIP